MSTAIAKTDILADVPYPSARVEHDMIPPQGPRNITRAREESQELGHIEDDEIAHEAESAKPRIGYRVEYRNRFTNDLLFQKTHDGNHYLDPGQTDKPIFEVVTSYKVLPDTDTDRAFKSLTLPAYNLRIHSVALINAIQSVVRYYPSQDLSGEYLTIPWPYPILVHHYDELQQFRQDCLSKPTKELCTREKDAAAHLRVILEYLDREVMKEVREEQERNRKGFETFDWFWVARKPGVTQLSKQSFDDECDACVIHSISGGAFDNPSSEWKLESWKINYVPSSITRVWQPTTYSWKFDGERKQAVESEGELLKFIDPTTSDEFLKDETALELIRRGEKFAEMLKPKCYQQREDSANLSPIGMDSLVMVDLETIYADFPRNIPGTVEQADLRNWESECTCDVCQRRKQDESRPKGKTPLFVSLHTIESSYSAHQLLLMPKAVPAYVFRTRRWTDVRICHLYEPEFKENMINHLVMSESRLRTLKALSKSFARVTQAEEVITERRWSADFVRGKGNGLIFLLHGKPGVGKTCTAECIAEFTRRPLMILTTCDIGTEPRLVEKNLTENFKKAMKWSAVLLIDEADVFMERRSTADLNRNSLVAGFLRALEYYDGILFLTTNRVGLFDDAFISRIHIQLYYPDFTDDERQRVWKTFIDKLARERGETIRLTIDAKEYIQSTRMQDLKWNGREIRNAFQTAVALAEYEADKDSEGRIMVKDDHLRAVVDLSKDFKGYLNGIHLRDEGKRAEQRHERLDSYEGPK